VSVVPSVVVPSVVVPSVVSVVSVCCLLRHDPPSGLAHVAATL
jgi:hypothetical protein